MWMILADFVESYFGWFDFEIYLISTIATIWKNKAVKASLILLTNPHVVRKENHVQEAVKGSV